MQLRGQKAPPLVELRACNIARPRKIDQVFIVDAARSWRHDHDSIGQKDRFLDRVGNENDGQAGSRPDLDQFVLQPFAGHRVERAEGFVHQHDFGIIGEHAGNGNALLHAARKLVRIDVGKILQTDEFGETIRRLADFGLGPPPRLRAEADIVADVEPGKQTIVLKDHAAARARARISACPTSGHRRAWQPRTRRPCAAGSIFRNRTRRSGRRTLLFSRADWRRATPRWRGRFANRSCRRSSVREWGSRLQPCDGLQVRRRRPISMTS